MFNSSWYQHPRNGSYLPLFDPYIRAKSGKTIWYIEVLHLCKELQQHTKQYFLHFSLFDLILL